MQTESIINVNTFNSYKVYTWMEFVIGIEFGRFVCFSFKCEMDNSIYFIFDESWLFPEIELARNKKKICCQVDVGSKLGIKYHKLLNFSDISLNLW